MPRATLLRAAVVSFILALLFPLTYVGIFGHSVSYEVPVRPENFSRMSPDEQQTWLKEHSRETRGLEVLTYRITDPRFWKEEYLWLAFPVFIVLVVACVAVVAWERKVVGSVSATPDGQRRRPA